MHFELNCEKSLIDYCSNREIKVLRNCLKSEMQFCTKNAKLKHREIFMQLKW